MKKFIALALFDDKQLVLRALGQWATSSEVKSS
jgi:hypothetical protein